MVQDFRNYQYTLPVVKGLVVDMEVRKTSIKIPSNRYNEVSSSTQKHQFRRSQITSWHFSLFWSEEVFIFQRKKDRSWI